MATTQTQQRKIAYFLGAGASLGAGAYASVQGGGHSPVPTQATFWDSFLRFCSDKANKKRIESFLFRYFLGYPKFPNRLGAPGRRELLRAVDVEEVFTFLSERARAPATTAQLRAYANEIWEALVTEIGPVFSRFEANTNTRSIYRSLLKNHIRSWDTIVSFNYDTIFEKSLPIKQKWSYKGINFKTRTLGILKPHGSVNWEDTNPIRVRKKVSKSVVVAPTHLKFVKTAEETADITGYLDQSPQIKDIWAEMETEMRQAKVLVFIGYSFPMADLYFSSVLRSVLASRDGTPGVVVVNPDAIAIRNRLKSRFALGRDPLVYFDLRSFAQSTRKQILDQLENRSP